MFENKTDNNVLTQIVHAIIEQHPENRDEFHDALRKVTNKLAIKMPPNRELLSAYQILVKKKSIEPNAALEEMMKKAVIRNLSGVAIITSLVKPYTCPGKCVYCPTEVKMPKSYIATEPAAARALRLDFSPYEQMARRMQMLEVNGHDTDKIEFIIKGGTWNAYPIKYQYWFINESFKACNNITRRIKIAPESEEDARKKTLEQLMEEAEKEQRYNEHAKHRIIGITLETRPDAISPKTIRHMRQQGCTRIELGLQAPDDAILSLIRRGHTVQQFRDAMYLLREAGFKVDLHFMPDLPGTTPDHDVDMYKTLFSDTGLRPDMVKIYPNTVIKSAELYQWFVDGKFKPYSEQELFRALLEMKVETPRYCRISRLIRDIPANEIYAGNTITNLRENLEKELHKQGKLCVCLRCREIGRQVKNLPLNAEPKLFVDEYDTIGGKEYFISFEDSERKAVFGFLRLRVPFKDPNQSDAMQRQVKELKKKVAGTKDCAFIRELHVYGTLVGIGKQNMVATQHKGVGKKLMKAAEDIIIQNNYKKAAVISGVGVRGYYRKLGYKKIGTYMVKQLKDN